MSKIVEDSWDLDETPTTTCALQAKARQAKARLNASLMPCLRPVSALPHTATQLHSTARTTRTLYRRSHSSTHSPWSPWAAGGGGASGGRDHAHRAICGQGPAR